MSHPSEGRAARLQPSGFSGPSAPDGRDEQTAPQKPTLRSALEIVGLVIAPATLLTALAFYFGWTFTNARASYFGIDPSTLGFSTSDYILRSVDALFVPVGAVLLAALGALALHSIAGRTLFEPRYASAQHRLVWICCIAGGILLGIGIVAALWGLPVRVHYLLPPISPGLGALLIAYGVYLARGSISTTATTVVGALVVLSMFWAAADYADALGRGRARDLARSLALRPGVVVYAKQRLQFATDGVTETRLTGSDAAYRYRYGGLRLLVRSGGKYFLVPATWTRASGVTIVLPDTNDLRVEFRPGG